MPGQSSRAPAALVPEAGTTRPIVVKLGGSVVRSGELGPWLDAIANAQVPIVVVPGGGALADEVRACQSRLGFGDAAAHRMALLAMDQLAWAVAGLRQGFTVGASEAELRDALARGSVAVWAPYAAIAGRAGIEQSWRLTSDSLALWLSRRIGAARCYLIKSIDRPKAPRLGARQLARDGVVDEAFAGMLAETGTPTILLGRGDQDSFVACAAEGQPCGAEIA
jgi:5-(aminomethyl)-3-furanmethanol phosphate kinase